MGHTAFWNGLIQSKSEDNLIQVLDTLSNLDDIEKVLVKSTHKIDQKKLHKACKKHRKIKRVTARKSKKIKTSANNSDWGDVADSRTENRLRVNPIYRKKDYNYKPKQVFVAMPFNKSCDQMYYQVWAPICNEFDYVACRADQPNEKHVNEPIINRIKRLVVESSILFADISGANPNVLYEVGIAHTIGRRVILFCDSQQTQARDLPFDIRSYEHIFYEFGHFEEIKEKLRREFMIPMVT